MKPHWISFWTSEPEHFEYHGPWWVSGEDMKDRVSIVAAVMAKDEKEAEKVIERAFDPGHEPDEWRFVTPKPADWNPLDNVSGRFPPAKWMKWPWPGTNAARNK